MPEMTNEAVALRRELKPTYTTEYSDELSLKKEWKASLTTSGDFIDWVPAKDYLNEPGLCMELIPLMWVHSIHCAPDGIWHCVTVAEVHANVEEGSSLENRCGLFCGSMHAAIVAAFLNAQLFR